MYESPIKIFESPINDIIKQMYEEKEKHICQCIYNVGVNVDKEELIKALKYDREQYNKGFEDALQQLREKCLEHQDFHKGDDGKFRGWVSVEDLDEIISEVSG